jgi:hypothetical protein
MFDPGQTLPINGKRRLCNFGKSAEAGLAQADIPPATTPKLEVRAGKIAGKNALVALALPDIPGCRNDP